MGRTFRTCASPSVFSQWNRCAKAKIKRVVIDAGDGNEHTVVCGAPNVSPGMIAGVGSAGHAPGRTNDRPDCR